MIRHIVLSRFSPESAPPEIAAIFADLADLRPHLSGMLAFAAGPNISPEPLGRGYTHAFTIDFADASARDAYLVHPLHKAAGGRLVAACAAGVDGILVIDFEL